MLFLCFLKREREGWCGMWNVEWRNWTLYITSHVPVSNISFYFSFLFWLNVPPLISTYLSIKGSNFVFSRFVFSVSFSWLVFIFSLFWWLIYIQDSWTHGIKIQRLLIPSRTLFSVFVFSEKFCFCWFCF